MTTDAPSMPGPARRSSPERVRAGLPGRALATRALAVVLWLVVVASAVSGVAALLRVEAMRRTAPAARPAAAGVAGAAGAAAGVAPAGLEGFAALYVACWLEDPAAAVRTFHRDAPVLGDVRRGERYVARSAAVAVAPTGGDTWSVTVGAEVLVAASGGYRRDGLHRFEVSIVRRGAGFAATSLPREVPAPAATFGTPAPRSSGMGPPSSRP